MERVLPVHGRKMILLLCIIIISNNSMAQQAPDGDPCPGMETFTDPRDGNIYHTVAIGNQCWLKENMRYLPRVDPLARNNISPVFDEYHWSSLYPHYYAVGYLTEEYNDSLYPYYGALYNWPAALEACPTGWYLPMDSDWEALTEYLSETYGLSNDREALNGIGSALRSCRQVNSPLGGECNTLEHPRWNDEELLSGDDRFGFSALPAGYGDIENHTYPGSMAYWWTIDRSTTSSAVSYSINGGALVHDNVSAATAHSIRCMKEVVPDNLAHQLEIQVNPPGMGEAEGSGRHSAGRKIPLRATAQQEYMFLNWSIDGEVISRAPVFVYEMPQKDVVIQASFVSLQGGNDGDPCPGFEVVTDTRDGHSYTTTMIDEQCWLRENAKHVAELGKPDYHSYDQPHYTIYGWTGPGSEAQAQENLENYGALYNWEAALTACPDGWRTAGNLQWAALIDYLLETYEYTTENVAWALRSCRQVNSPLGEDCDTEVHPRWDENDHYGTDRFNLSLLPGGSQDYYPPYYSGLGDHAYFWSATPSLSPISFFGHFLLDSGMIDVRRADRDAGFSVRCVREAPERATDRSIVVSSQPPEGGTASRSGSYYPGQMVALNAQPAPGHRFSHWSGGNERLWDTLQATTYLMMPDDALQIIAVFEGTVSSNPLSTGNTINIYPSPAGNVLWVEMQYEENATASLMNIQGKMIRQKAFGGNGRISFRTGHLKQGLYLVVIRGDNLMEVKKVVIGGHEND